jgi:mycothiol synthase
MLSVRVLRPPAPGDVRIIRALEAVTSLSDGYESLSWFVQRDIDAPSPESVGFVADEDGATVGYAHLAPSDTLADPHLVGGLVVHPAHRAGGHVTRELLDAIVRESEARAGRVVLWVNGATDELEAHATAAGFVRVSEQFQMRVPLPLAETPKWPPGMTVRSFVPGRDDAAWLLVNNRAFRNHPDQGGWAEVTLQRRLREPWFDPAGFLLAFDAGGLAGFCWTKVHDSPPDGRLGEIYVIGVDPDRQGTGLGRALTVGGLDHLAREARCPTGMLYVDAANPAALGLYRSLGFEVHRSDRAYEWKPAPG